MPEDEETENAEKETKAKGRRARKASKKATALLVTSLVDTLVHVGRCRAFTGTDDKGAFVKCPGAEHYGVVGDDGVPDEKTWHGGPAKYYFSRGVAVKVTCPDNMAYFADRAERNPDRWTVEEV